MSGASDLGWLVMVRLCVPGLVALRLETSTSHLQAGAQEAALLR